MPTKPYFVIVNAAIVRSDSSKRRYQATVMVEYENGDIEDLFDYYDDEIRFTSSEFIGHTEQEALDLFMKKDMAYIQS